MSVKFQFIDRQTNKTVPLARIDDMLRQENSLPEDKNEFSQPYNMLTLVGLNISWHDGRVTKVNFGQFLMDYENKLPANYIEMCRKYLLDRYEFTTWR